MIDKVDKVFLFQNMSLCLQQLKWAIRKYMMLAKSAFLSRQKEYRFLTQTKIHVKHSYFYRQWKMHQLSR